MTSLRPFAALVVTVAKPPVATFPLNPAGAIITRLSGLDAFVLCGFAAVALIHFDSRDEALICCDSRDTPLFPIPHAEGAKAQSTPSEE